MAAHLQHQAWLTPSDFVLVAPALSFSLAIDGGSCFGVSERREADHFGKLYRSGQSRRLW